MPKASFAVLGIVPKMHKKSKIQNLFIDLSHKKFYNNMRKLKCPVV